MEGNIEPGHCRCTTGAAIRPGREERLAAGFAAGAADLALLSDAVTAVPADASPEVQAAADQIRTDRRAVSDAVIRLRRRKLPDPAVAGNAGSFFKNPVIARDQAEQLRSRHAELLAWPLENGKVKLSAAWMIEACGLKGRREGGARVSEQHALVLVNEGGASGHDVSALAVEVQKTVYEAFGLRLEPEPKLIEFPSG